MIPKKTKMYFSFSLRHQIFQFLIASMFLLVQHSNAQVICPFDNTLATNLPNQITFGTPGDSVINTCVMGGEYVQVNVCLGANYTFKTCTTPGFLDSKVAVYDTTGLDTLAYNDDACGFTGWLSLVNWTSSFNGLVYVLVDDISCTPNTNCYELTVVQNTPCCSEPIVQTFEVTCNGLSDGWAVVTGVGAAPWTYSWKDSLGNTIKSSANNFGNDTVYGLAAGNYSVLVQETSACILTKNFSVSEPPALTLATSDSVEHCVPGMDGRISTSVSGGTPAYAYLWSNGATTQDATSLGTGAYGLTVTDQNSCTISASDTVNLEAPTGPAGLWTWNGQIDTDWFEPCNWDKISVPDSSSNVLIPGATANNPIINGGTGNCFVIEIASDNGALLTIYDSTGATLRVTQP